MQRLIIVTTTRADWGILSPLAQALDKHPGVSLTVVAAGTHMSEKYGLTINEIQQDGLKEVVEITSPTVEDDNPLSRTILMSRLATDMASLLEAKAPDAVIILGDRYEMLGVASAALIANVPIVHLHGGEISEGALDDAVRHALTKMASLHLVATQKSAMRVIAMGEEPRRVVRIGSIGVENALTIKPLTLEELRQSLNDFNIDPSKTLLVTFHPVTRHPEGKATKEQIDSVLKALDMVQECNAIITYPNNDVGSEEIIQAIEKFGASHSDRVKVVPSLGKKRYISALWHVLAVVGNTSSGILEAPSTQAATINIGPRQKGRECAFSVIHVNENPEEISSAIKKIMINKVENTENPYFRKDAVKTAVKAITEILPKLSIQKTFYTPNNEIKPKHTST